MKWKEMSVLHKIVYFICLLFIVAYIILAVLDSLDILANTNMLQRICMCVFSLCQGILYWDTRRKLAIFWIVSCGAFFLLILNTIFN